MCEPPTPEAWYAEIEALRKAGRNAEADAELARFEAAYPDWIKQHGRTTAVTPSRVLPWVALALVSLANFGNFYVYDSIGPVADLLELQRGFSNSQIGMLNAIYNLPNIVLLLVGGILVDRFGAARMLTWTAAICLAGALLTAYAPAFTGMAGGRLLFGIGAETFSIAHVCGHRPVFPERHLAFAMGLSMALGRGGAYLRGHVADLVRGRLCRGLAAAARDRGAVRGDARWSPCGIYWWLDHRNGPRSAATAARSASRSATSPASAAPTGTCSCSACSGTR